VEQKWSGRREVGRAVSVSPVGCRVSPESRVLARVWGPRRRPAQGSEIATSSSRTGQRVRVDLLCASEALDHPWRPGCPGQGHCVVGERVRRRGVWGPTRRAGWWGRHGPAAL